MLRRFGWFYKLLGFGRRLSKVEFEEHSVERVREAHRKGPVVYVLHQASAIDHLALNAVLNRRRLPLSIWSNGTNSFWWQPVAAAWRDLVRRLTQRDDPIADGWLTQQVASGAVVALFLKGRRWFSPRSSDAFQAVLTAQERSERPIQLIPIAVIWTPAPELSNPVQNFLLGRGHSPGILHQLRNIWFRAEGAIVQAGTPLDLAEFCRRSKQQNPVRVLRTVLRRYLQRESMVRTGPRNLPYGEMQRVVLDNPELRALAAEEASRQGVSVAKVRAQMEKEYRLIAANFRWWVIRVSDVALRVIWTQMFSGVDVRSEDIERLRAALRDGSSILIPCHKSHADYLLISWVCYEHNLIVPHVIAGANLAIWPVSIFLRSAGGFFIKRRFAGEVLHPAIFSRYLRELVYRGYPVEFYIEGGRTRSGKLLRPRVGVLGMLFDAAEHRPHDHEVTLLPISLAYEEVAEERSYAREAGGEEKRPESMGQLIRARSVLKRRFGRVYLRVGEPIPLGQHVDPTEGTPKWSDRGEASKKALLHRVGDQVMYRIGAVTVVLPTCLCAAALLAHHRRGIRQDVLTARVVRFRAFLAARGAMEAASLEHFDQAIRTALNRFARAGHIQALEQQGSRVWSIGVSSRISLEFYKNQLLHYFAPAGYVALVMRARPVGPVSVEELLPGFGFLRELWDQEFRFNPDQTDEELVREGLTALVEYGALNEVEHRFEVAEVEQIGEIYQLFRNFVEAYLLVLRRTDQLHGQTKKSFPKLLLKDSDALLSVGVVTRPEALSTITLGNAVSTYLRRGVFMLRGDELGFNEDLVNADLNQLSPMVE